MAILWIFAAILFSSRVCIFELDPAGNHSVHISLLTTPPYFLSTSGVCVRTSNHCYLTASGWLCLALTPSLTSLCSPHLVAPLSHSAPCIVSGVQMAPRLTEICENCTVTQLDLRRCSGCGLVRYCVRVASLLFFYSRIFRRGVAIIFSGVTDNI